jgi:hypothetical protein
LRGGDKLNVTKNLSKVFVSIMPTAGDASSSDIVYNYFFPYQGKTFLNYIGGHAPGSAHTSDWEKITVRIKNNDALNPIAYGMSQHGNTEWVHEPGKIRFKFTADPENKDRGSFYVSQNVHSIYDESGETDVGFANATVDYHRRSNVHLKGGRPILIYAYNRDLAHKVDLAAAQQIAWQHDWGFHVLSQSYTDDSQTVAPWGTAVDPLKFLSSINKFMDSLATAAG